MRRQKAELLLDLRRQTGNDFVGMRLDRGEQRLPTSKRQRVRALHRKMRAGEMEFGERLAETCAMLDARPPHRDAVEEGNQCRRSPGKLVQHAALAVADREWAGNASGREMLH